VNKRLACYFGPVVVLDEDPFPTEGVVPEHRQIGRLPAIEGLARRLQIAGQHWALIDARRIGKSSVALAALDRLAGEPGIVTIDVDLRRAKVDSEVKLVRALRRAAGDAGVRVGQLKRASVELSKLLQQKTPAALRDIGALLGASEELTTAKDLGGVLAGMIGGDEPIDLADQLLLFEAWGRAHDTVIVVFIDEVQDLASWSGGAAVDSLARAMRHPLRHVRLLFAGSEKHAMNELFAAGRPLRENTLDFDLPPIARVDWLHDLPDRFREMGCQIDLEALEAIVDATPGRPLRTNQVCLQAAMGAPDYGDGESHITVDVAQFAIELVSKRDRWEEDADDE
jgi:hypothetical protein